MIDFEKLAFFQKAHELALKVYHITKEFPSEERFGMIPHLRKTVFSIPSNIAEGCGRNGNRELFNFLNIASGSASELNYQMRLAHELGYMTKETHTELHVLVIDVQKMIRSYMKTLKDAT